MSKQNIVNQFQTSASVSQIVAQLKQEKNHFQISNLVGSSLSFVISETFKKADKPYLLIFNDKEEAAYYLNDLEQLLGDKNVLFYPGSYRRPYQIEETDNANVLLRSEVLNRINSRKKTCSNCYISYSSFRKSCYKKRIRQKHIKSNCRRKLIFRFCK